MRTQQLACVVAVAEERSFSRAADRMGMAQPSLSRQVRMLELQLGFRLFHRGPGQSSVEMTPEGEAILPFARRVLADIEAVLAEARSLAGVESGRLRLGATPSLTTSLLPQVMANFAKQYPKVAIDMVEAGSHALVSKVAEGAVDLALVVLPAHDPLVGTSALFDDRLVLAVPAGHLLAGRSEIGLADLAGVPIVLFQEGYDLREVTLKAMERAGVTPKVALQGGEMDGVLAFVAAGLGAAIVPEIVIGGSRGLVGLPFADPGLVRTVALAHRNDRPLTRAAQALISVLDQSFGERRLLDRVCRLGSAPPPQPRFSA